MCTATLRLLVLIHSLGTCMLAPAEAPTEVYSSVDMTTLQGRASEMDLHMEYRHPRLRSRKRVQGNTEAYTVEARRGTEYKPRLGDKNKPMEIATEEVVSGTITFEGLIPEEARDGLPPCVLEVLAGLAAIPISHIYLFFTNKYDAERFKDIVKYTFILLPIKGKSDDTSTAIHQSQLASPGESVAQFLVLLSREMAKIHALNEYFVLSVQWSISVPEPEISMLEIWRSPEYGKTHLPDYLQVGPSTRAPTTEAPPSTAPDMCLSISTACSCARVGICTWVENRYLGTWSCAKGFGVSCAACAEQARCSDDGCSEVSNPCACAASSYGCRWNELMKYCESGSGTSCVACPRQWNCKTAIPKVVSYQPPSGSYIKALRWQKVVLVFDRAVYLMDSVSAKASFLCDGGMVIINVPRVRMTALDDHLELDIGDLVPSTNNGRHCDLVIDEGLLSDEHGVFFLGLQDGEYSIHFGDTLPPKVLAISPTNGETDVEPTAITITMTFSEPIVLALVAQYLKIELSILEDSEVLVPVADFELKSSRVKVESQILKVDLGGKVEPGLLYTLSLPRGAVTDVENNIYAGLQPRAYSFQTVPKETRVQRGGGEQGIPVTSLIGITAALSMVLGITILSVWWFSCTKRAQKKQLEHERLNDRLSGHRPASVDTSRSSLRSSSAREGLSPGSSGCRRAWSSVSQDQSAHDGADDMMGHCMSEPCSPQPCSPPLHPPLRRSNTWVSSSATVSPAVSPKHGGPRASLWSDSSIMKGSLERARLRQQHTDARRRWKEAFEKAKAVSKNANGKGMKVNREATCSTADETAGSSHGHGETGPRSAGDAGYERREAGTAGDEDATADENWDSQACNPDESASSTNNYAKGGMDPSEPSTSCNPSSPSAEARRTHYHFTDPCSPHASSANKDWDSDRSPGRRDHATSKDDVPPEPTSPNSPEANGRRTSEYSEPSSPTSPGAKGSRTAEYFEPTSPTSPGPKGSRTSEHSEPASPTSPGAKGRRTSEHSEPTSPTSPSAKGRRTSEHSEPTSPTSPNAKGRRTSEQPSSAAVTSITNPELRRLIQDIEVKMREHMDLPLAERKKVLRELMLQYHPDKNSDAYAKEIFQFISSARTWFLCET